MVTSQVEGPDRPDRPNWADSLERPDLVGSPDKSDSSNCFDCAASPDLLESFKLLGSTDRYNMAVRRSN